MLLVILSVSTGSAQDLRLEISVPKTEIKDQEPVNLTVKLVNNSSTSYFVSGDVLLGAGGIGHEFGAYRLQFKETGASEFLDLPVIFADGFPQSKLSLAEFIATNKLVLLRNNMFIGRTLSSTWDGLTLLKPGRYAIRVTYTSHGDERAIPTDMPFPIFRSSLVSNVIDLEIQQ
jgi:hypothetical protein